jgi:VWFA-related protein
MVRRVALRRILILSTLASSAIAAAQTTQPKPQVPVFKTGSDLIRAEVRVWDKDHKFIPGLGPKDFQILEDGVPQTIQAFLPYIGNRVVGEPLRPATAPPSPGLILPPTKAGADSSGRIFIVFIDDLHLQPSDTPRVRQWLRDVRDILIHDNDLVGFVSSGFSNVQGPVTYDYQHRRFNDVISKVVGVADTPNDIIRATTTSEGPAGLKHRVNVAFSTVYGLLDQLAPITDRTKVLVYVSSGYDLNPHKDSRYREEQAKYSTTPQGAGGAPPGSELNDPNYVNPFDRSGAFLDADLVAQLAELINAAVRTNTTFYPMDPRGLLSSIPDISQNISPQEWMAHTTTQHSTLRTLASETNGICICNVNDPKPLLRQIDNATSDYYLIGYVSTNPDPRHLRRRIEIIVTHPNARELSYPREYVLARRKS